MQLMTEQNTEAMRRKVITAAKTHFGGKNNNAVFEHGQWWIFRPDGSQYSVIDAEGPGTTNGFDFEMVTPPED